MGQLNSAGAAASLIAYVGVIALSRFMPKTNYTLLHGASGVIALIGGILVMRRAIISSGVARRTMEFNTRYMSYYVLTFLGGARRQMATTFAAFLLVSVYHAPVGTMVLLSAISSIIAIFTRSAIGRLIDGWGEQRSLIVNYSIVVPIFLMYGLNFSSFSSSFRHAPTP